FLQKSAKELGVEAKRITDAALARLMRFDFPGNVRQLENICHWLTVMAPAQMIEAKDLPPELAVESSVAEVAPVAVEPAPAPAAAALGAPIGAAPLVAAPHWLGGLEQEARSLLQSGDPQVWDTLTHKFEAQLIRTALEITRGRRIEAAQKLGIGRNTITRKIQELGLDD
ncbi:MAG: helix-turn-helix domain-containing protein, partial [Pseudomonadota bacterium]